MTLEPRKQQDKIQKQPSTAAVENIANNLNGYRKQKEEVRIENKEEMNFRVAPNLEPVLISNKSPSIDKGSLSPDEVVYNGLDIKTIRPKRRKQKLQAININTKGHIRYASIGEKRPGGESPKASPNHKKKIEFKALIKLLQLKQTLAAGFHTDINYTGMAWEQWKMLKPIMLQLNRRRLRSSPTNNHENIKLERPKDGE